MSPGTHRAEADAVINTLRSAALPIAALAIVNSMLLIGAHCRENRHSALRVFSVRILLMVVVDSVAAVCALWGSGWMPQADPYVENIMHFMVELYESVVIFSFLQFVLACGAGPDRLAKKFAKRQRANSCRSQAASEAADRDAREVGAASSRMSETPSSSSLSTPEEGEVDAEIGVASFASVCTDGHEGRQKQADSGKEATASTTLTMSLRTPRGEPAENQSSSAEAETTQGTAEGAAGAGRKLKHLPGLGRILPRWRSGQQMLRWCVFGTLTYVVVGAALAVVGLFLLVIPMDGNDKQMAWTVSGVFLSAAQAIAIFALAELAINMREEIALLRPYGKFLSVKFVVFFAFWQGLLLKALQGFGLFGFFGEGHRETLGVTVIHNFLICVEMLAASFIHFHVFPPHDFLKLLAQHRLQDVDATSPTALALPPTVTEVVDFRDIFRTAQQVHLCRTKEMPVDSTDVGAERESPFRSMRNSCEGRTMVGERSGEAANRQEGHESA